LQPKRSKQAPPGKFTGGCGTVLATQFLAYIVNDRKTLRAVTGRTWERTTMKKVFAVTATLVLLCLGSSAQASAVPHPYWEWSEIQQSADSFSSLVSEISFTARFTSNDLFGGGALQLHDLVLDSMITLDGGATWEQINTTPGIEWTFQSCDIDSNADFRHEFLVARRVGPTLAGYYMPHLNTSVNDSFPHCIDGFGVAGDAYTPVPEPSSIIALLGGLGSLLALRRRKR